MNQLAIKLKNDGSFLYKRKVVLAKKQYYEECGYVADPNLRTKRNRVEVLNKMPRTFFNKPSKMKFHNLCNYKQSPQGIGELLGLGHKFVIQMRKSNPQIEK
eukprot:2506710-Ditylum_brightwellii.AAC.1